MDHWANKRKTNDFNNWWNWFLREVAYSFIIRVHEDSMSLEFYVIVYDDCIPMWQYSLRTEQKTDEPPFPLRLTSWALEWFPSASLEVECSDSNVLCEGVMMALFLRRAAEPSKTN